MDELREHRRAALERQLRRNQSGDVRFDATSRGLYATDASIYQIEPLGVVLPRNLKDLYSILQIASEHSVPIVPRGGGTSLSGQAVGPGLVIDCSKYLNHILEIDPTNRRCRVQPGVVLSQLNQATAAHGLQFGPDVSTANRATLGGMIGNNSAGSHSLVYGKTVDHVLALQVLLADGTPARLAMHSTASLPEVSPFDPAARLAEAALRVIEPLAEDIDARFPKILRRVSGYNFPEVLAQSRQGHLNLASLVVGSEGTLTFVSEAELNLVPLPRYRGLVVPHFTSLPGALEALSLCLDAGPSAVELLDQLILDLARENLELKRRMAGIEGRPAAIFMVEFASDDELEVASKVDHLAARLAKCPGVTTAMKVTAEADRERLWRLREAGLPLLMGLPGDRKPVTFVEDTAVPTERLPEYAARFHEVLREHGTSGAFYGHASVGCLHIRPLLNLKQPADVKTMRRISDAITNLLLEFGGSLSGEHGDGLARGEWNRKMFGDTVYAGFQAMKLLFDPGQRLNPGKVVNAPPMTMNLRLGEHYHPLEPSTLLSFDKHGGLVRHVELCSGTAVCRKLDSGAMCPSYRATRDEEHSTRGRANALRLALASPEPLKELRSADLMAVLDLCLSCKACKSECPSNVDLAKLKAEVTEIHYRDRQRPFMHLLLKHLPHLLAVGAAIAPAVNLATRLPPLRWLLEKTAGLTASRTLPQLHANHFRHWYWWHRPKPPAGRLGRVLLLDDCFTTYFEPEVGIAAVRLLEAFGYRVERLGICCGRALFSKGLLREARQLVQNQATALAQRVATGLPILGLEPSCLLSLVDEWPELVQGPATQAIAQASWLVEDWLDRHWPADLNGPELESRAERIVFHGHCHQRAIVGVETSTRLLARIPKIEINSLDAGCCGMAGTFGYERDHVALSQQIFRQGLEAKLSAEPRATVIASGTSCRHQIRELAHRPACHPLEFLVGALNTPLSRNSPPTS